MNHLSQSSTFISFNNLCDNYVERSREVEAYIDWLNEHAGRQYIGWRWATGDRFASGVFILDKDVAVMFKLAFAT